MQNVALAKVATLRTLKKNKRARVLLIQHALARFLLSEATNPFLLFFAYFESLLAILIDSAAEPGVLDFLEFR